MSTFLGYGLLLSIPLLALANRWETAAALLIAERVGKAVRTPSRDAILSHATKEMGRGWGFALHEALDQIGAVIGPLIVAAAFLLTGGYRRGFSILWIPALLTLLALVIAWRCAVARIVRDQRSAARHLSVALPGDAQPLCEPR